MTTLPFTDWIGSTTTATARCSWFGAVLRQRLAAGSGGSELLAGSAVHLEVACRRALPICVRSAGALWNAVEHRQRRDPNRALWTRDSLGMSPPTRQDCSGRAGAVQPVKSVCISGGHLVQSLETLLGVDVHP